MSNKITGGPAFPCGTPYTGMTMRDYFATKAMQANLVTIKEFPDEHWRFGLALDAYAMADAMLEARSK